VDRDSLQCATGAILVDQVGNVENTCYNARFFKPIYLTRSTPPINSICRSIHEVALSHIYIYIYIYGYLSRLFLPRVSYHLTHSRQHVEI